MRIVVPSVLAALTFATIVAADVVAAVLAATIVWLIAYALANAPARRRSHGLDQIKQATDHNAGRFGGTYREEVPGDERRDTVGRNDVCPCGSGEKYKRCSGA